MAAQWQALARERDDMRAARLAREARLAAEQQRRLADEKRQAAVTLYQQERERAERQGKRVLPSVDEYRNSVPGWVRVDVR